MVKEESMWLKDFVPSKPVESSLLAEHMKNILHQHLDNSIRIEGEE